METVMRITLVGAMVDDGYTHGDFVQDAKAVYDVVGAVEKDKVRPKLFVGISA